MTSSFNNGFKNAKNISGNFVYSLKELEKNTNKNSDSNLQQLGDRENNSARNALHPKSTVTYFGGRLD